MTALYNEIDPKAAVWLRALIDAGHIAPGIVNECSIEDLTPAYLSQFTQVHFFAGIGVWSYALRAAGWPDDRPVWTGSCPCQPFSAAGKGGGFDDERHLWPAFHWLIDQCRPDVVFGEQVASKDGLGWLDLVQADLEGSGYASGAVDLCAAGVGAPHIRQRLWWYGERILANPNRIGSTAHTGDAGEIGRLSEAQRKPKHSAPLSGGGGSTLRLGNGNQPGLEGQRGRHKAESGRDHAGRPVAEAGGLERLADRDGSIGGQGRPVGGGSAHRGDAVEGAGLSGGGEPKRLAHTESGRAPDQPGSTKPNLESGAAFERGFYHGANGGTGGGGDPTRDRVGGALGKNSDGVGRRLERPGPTNGLWGDADWLHCRDGKWRPVEPGTFPLAHGAPERVGRLRGYGNAIVAPAAQAFIEAYLDATVI